MNITKKNHFTNANGKLEENQHFLKVLVLSLHSISSKLNIMLNVHKQYGSVILYVHTRTITKHVQCLVYRDNQHILGRHTHRPLPIIL